jgi:hypothetical protein
VIIAGARRSREIRESHSLVRLGCAPHAPALGRAAYGSAATGKLREAALDFRIGFPRHESLYWEERKPPLTGQRSRSPAGM